MASLLLGRSVQLAALRLGQGRDLFGSAVLEGLGGGLRVEILGGDGLEGEPEPGGEKRHDSKDGPRYDDHPDSNRVCSVRNGPTVPPV